MNNKAYSQNCNTEEVADISSIIGKATVGGGTNLIKLGRFHAKKGMKAYRQGRKEYLLEQGNDSEH